MTWNYRVVKAGQVRNEPLAWFEIREVYYNESGEIESWSSEPSSPYGDTRVELDHDHAAMARAFSMPVLSIVDGKLIEEGS